MQLTCPVAHNTNVYTENSLLQDSVKYTHMDWPVSKHDTHRGKGERMPFKPRHSGTVQEHILERSLNSVKSNKGIEKYNDHGNVR